MSGRNGDRSRFHRVRKQKIARRKRTLELVTASAVKAKAPKPASAAKAKAPKAAPGVLTA